MYTELPNIEEETPAVKDYLTLEVSAKELSKKYGLSTKGQAIAEKVRRERKTPKITLDTREELEAFMELIPGRMVLGRWLGLSPAKTGALIFNLNISEDKFRELYEEEGMSINEIAEYINSPYITAAMLRDKAKRLHFYHKEGETLEISKREFARYINDDERVAKNNRLRRETMKERYGVDSISPMAVKHFSVKANEAVIEHYGGLGKASPELSEKIENTMMERYGVSNNKKSIDLIAKSINWHETEYVHSAKEALELLERDENGYPSKLISYLENLVEEGKFKSFYLWQIGEEILGLSKKYMYSTSLNLHPDGKLIVMDYRVSQNEVVDFIESLGISNDEIITDRYPKFMKGKQLDIYIPSKNFGIEYNGTYFHSAEFGKGRKYHQNKTLSAREGGITLMHIWEYDWRNPIKQPIVKSQIKYQLGKVDVRYYARKLSLSEITYKQKHDFLETNHIQGDVSSSENYGLFDNDELVAVMTFGKRRFDKEDGWELLRFATKLNSSVAGGASKLLKSFANKHEGDKLISYANSDFAHDTDKSLYSKLGFTYVRTTVPGYKWVLKDKQQIVSRYAVQPHKLKAYSQGTASATFENEVPDFSEDDTEISYMTRHGFVRLYDAGNDLYEITL